MAPMIISPILGSITGWIPTYVIEPIRKWFRVLQKDKENMEELEKKAAKLDARSKGQQAKVEEAKKLEGVAASEEGKLWFSQANEAVSDTSKLRTEFNEQQRRGPFPSCFFCCSRYQMSKKALKLMENVDELHKEEPKSGWTTAISEKGRHVNTVSIEGQNRTEKLKHEMIEAVLGERYVVVGLQGMGGIGKTTLLRLANEHFRNTEHFESVIFVTVSATPDFVDLRKQIAQSLRLAPEEFKDDNVLKEKLSYLIERKKYLLILDDMWDPIIDLGEICNIPAPKMENGCKILMASRKVSVITKFVNGFAARDSLHLIQVNKLLQDEAWNLFVEKVGAHIASKPAIEPLAKEVARKCDGLPLAILVIGGTMSTRETEAEWKNVVRQLRQPSSTSNIEGVPEEVFPILMVSFKKLIPIEQSLFLYCCLFPEDYSIWKSSFYDFSISEETLCDEMQLNLEDLRNKVDDLLGKLRTSSMLEYDGFGVKMHDAMRDLGVWITSPTTTSSNYHSKYIVKARARITEAADAPEWCNATKISLMSAEIESLPQLRDQCLQLHTLFLQGCSRIKEIPQEHFLDHMPTLHFLDLSGTMIEFLPPSVSYLVNLRILLLSNCGNLKELPPEIGMLGQLISLDLSRCTSLIKLPVGMRRLNNLRCLDISYTDGLEKIPQGVLSGLDKLVELDTRGSRLTLNTDFIMELSEVIHCLTFVWISKAKIENENVSQRLKPILATGIDDLHLCNCVIDPSALPDLLLEDFPYHMKFTSCEGLTRVPTRGCISLTVQGCPDLKNLLSEEEIEEESEEESRSHIAFKRSEILELDQPEELETICKGVPQQPRCFSNLSEITIKGCTNLKVLFTSCIIRLLKRLTFLSVYQCPQLVYLIESNDVEEMEIISAFPSLKIMISLELPELTAICNNHYHSDVMEWPSLPTTKIYLCPKLTTPPFRIQQAAISLNKETYDSLVMSLNDLGQKIQTFVLKLGVYDHEAKTEAIRAVDALPGVYSIAIDVERLLMTVIGKVHPVDVVGILRKRWHADIVSVGPP